jgi:hypothetical protein
MFHVWAVPRAKYHRTDRVYRENYTCRTSGFLVVEVRLILIHSVDCAED